jgi:GGDEF domain-containing protein
VVCKLNPAGLTNESLLRSIASGFQRCCDPNDTLAGISKDEFAFLFRGTAAQNCSSKMEVIAETVRRTCTDHQVEMQAPASIGAAFYPADAKTAEELLGVAQRRMFSQTRVNAGAVPEGQRKSPPQMAAVA